MYNRDRLMLWAVGGAVLLLSGYLVLAAARPDYRGYQREFRELVEKKLGPQRASKTPEGVQQIWLASLNSADRCQSCHLGLTWKDLKGVPGPFQRHSAALLASHPPEKFGCTLCHGGQGSATVLPDAHGWVDHWQDKLLDRGLAEEYGVKDPHAFKQIRCNGCHRYERRIKGAEMVNAGKALIVRKGCRACHVINGRGGAVGPDLTREGEKTPEQFDYARLTGIPSVFAWQVGHLQDPKSYSPTTVMPNFGFTSEQAQSITLVLMSWRDLRLPIELLPDTPRRDVPTAEETERDRMMMEGEGKFFVEKTCFICHEISAFGIESATKIGPDLSIAVEDAPNRFGRSLDEFLRAPTGTMQVVLSRQITLTEKELDEAIRLLKVAYQKHKSQPASKPAPAHEQGEQP